MRSEADLAAEVREWTEDDRAYTVSLIAQTLNSLSVKLNGKGGTYLSEVLWILLTEQSGMENIADALRQVGERHQIDAESVRSSIRYTVEKAWMEGEPDIQFRYFGRTVDFKRGKPTESDFIAVLAMRIRHDLHAYRKRRRLTDDGIPPEMK